MDASVQGRGRPSFEVHASYGSYPRPGQVQQSFPVRK